MHKTTIKASSDIALVKYWGKKDEVLRLPENGSISLILDGLDTVTTVEWRQDLTQDDVTIQGDQDPDEVTRVVKHLDRIRSLAQSNGVMVADAPVYAKVVSQNTFPKGTGLSSSGSGFAALTYAATKAAGVQLTERELSILARQGSGTACRCACGGFVEWKDGTTSETSYSESLFPPEYWDIRDVVAVVDEGRKKTSSSEGHQRAQTSIVFAPRQAKIAQKIQDVKQALAARDFTQLGELVEAECLEFHSVLLTSQPPMIMWYPGSLQVMQEVVQMRADGIPAYFTINTGFNVHILTLPEYEQQVQTRIAALPLVKKTLLAKVGSGPVESTDHLF
jgi:diphosphomevalonate decarboxylase